MGHRRSHVAIAPSLVAAVVLVLGAVGLPVLGRDAPAAVTSAPASTEAPAPTEAPSATQAPEATGSATPGNGDPPGKPPRTGRPGRGNAGSKPEELPVTLTGRVGARAEADGGLAYTLTVGSTVYELDAGPPWWWGEDHPLARVAGTRVTIGGTQAPGSTEVDVRAIDGTAFRDAGRPPWAGGPRAVGPSHPGWKAWKAAKGDGGDRKGAGPPPWAGPKTPEATSAPGR